MRSEKYAQEKWNEWTIRIKVWKILAVMVTVPVVVFWLQVVHQEDEIIALSRNEVMVDPAGKRTWHGSFTNTADIPFRDLGVTVNFLDSSGAIVGRAEAETDELPPWADINLQAELPDEAVNMRIYSVRWRNDSTATMFGPFREPWEFGYLMYDPAG
ncbi:MAG: FxLYD domain-containing protein [Gammaproteobacteria bacterium]|nr:FxLYD domain-containing protein [Gammaproteobacteria bacterium]MDP2141508.1 FxLYD domain-containing protein [Gammaproteobacteria bacterium]MDP2347467.1 FxLYD domain-containing protein [Gammaproteobacteria bacterium]